MFNNLLPYLSQPLRKVESNCIDFAPLFKKVDDLLHFFKKWISIKYIDNCPSRVVNYLQ